MLVGGAQDRSASEQAAALAVTELGNLTGELSIQETCALMEHAALVITTDSGPLHLAGARKRPAVGLFRAIRPEYGSLYPSVVPVLWDGGETCLEGCSWDSWHGCRTTPCRQLVGIPVEKIVAASKRQFENTEPIPSAK
jgi:ADP-heptose:LPS heptosyltransferase